MFTNNLTKNKPRSVNGEEKCHAKCCGDDHVMKEKNKPFIIHMNEMVSQSNPTKKNLLIFPSFKYILINK